MQTLIDRVCATCFKSFQAVLGEVNRGCGLYCSKHCVPPWNKGLKGKQPYHNISGLRLNPETQFKSGAPSAFKGRKHTLETRIKIGKNQEGKKLTAQHIKNSLKRRTISSLEMRVQRVIDKHELPYKFVGNGTFFIEKKNPDFININGEKKAVEVYARRHKEVFRGGVEEWKNERKEVFSRYGWSIIFIEDWQTNKDETILELLRGG